MLKLSMSETPTMEEIKTVLKAVKQFESKREVVTEDVKSAHRHIMQAFDDGEAGYVLRSKAGFQECIDMLNKLGEYLTELQNEIT